MWQAAVNAVALLSTVGSVALEKNVQGIWRVGLNWSAARSLAIADEKWWQHTPLSESNTNGERWWFIYFLPTRTQTLEQEYSDSAVSNRRPSTPWPTQATPRKLFTRNPIVWFLVVDKTSVNALGVIPWFLKNFSETEIFVCSVMARMKTALGIIQFCLFYYFARLPSFNMFTESAIIQRVWTQRDWHHH